MLGQEDVADDSRQHEGDVQPTCESDGAQIDLQQSFPVADSLDGQSDPAD